MRQTLFYVPSTLFGYPLFGWGIFLVLIVIITLVAVLLRIRKHGMDADAWGFLPLAAAAAAIVVFIVPNMVTPQGLPVRGYGTVLTIAILSAIVLLTVRAKKLWNIPSELMISLSIWCVVSGILGARVFYVFQYWSESIRKPTLQATLWSIVSISEGGLVVYGSIIGGIVGALIFLLWNRLPILATLDLLAPAMLLGIAIGRIGCLMNGCCFGGACDLAWAITFPIGSNVHYHQIQHNDVFIGGLKFSVKDPDHAEKPWKELIELDPTRLDESLTNYAKDKRSRLQIEEVQQGSEAEKVGLRKGMTVLAFGATTDDIAEPTNSLKTPLFLAKDKHDWMRFIVEVLEYRKTFQQEETEKLRMIVATDTPEPFHLYTIPLEPLQVLPVHPTQVYSSIFAVLGCCLLLYFSRFCRKDGQVFLMFLFYYPLTRFILEIIRTDEGSFFGTGLTVSQNVSLIVLAGALLLSVFLHLRSRRRAYESLFANHSSSNP